MGKKKELSDAVAVNEEINEVDGQPIYHANEGGGEDEGTSKGGEEENGKKEDMH